MKQKIHSNLERENKYHNNDEIDLFDLFQKIWKWKWLTAMIIIIICCIIFFYLKLSPVTYSIESTIRIGKIAGLIIESDSDVQAYLKSNIFKETDICMSYLDIRMQSINNNKDLLRIYSKADSPDILFSCFEKVINNLLNRHKTIYSKTLKKINDNIALIKTKTIIEPKYILDTYTFQTSLINKPEKSRLPDNKKIPAIMAVTFFASLFFGVFLSLFIDYILANIKKKK